MKLASLKYGRDGALVVFDRDLKRCARAPVATLQAALEDWGNAEDKLRAVEPVEVFDPGKCASPLPRAYQIADGSAYLNHIMLVRKARGADMPPEFKVDPLMYQGVSDIIMGPTDPIPVASEAYGIDFEAEVAVITDDVPMGVSSADALAHVRLIMLMNDVSLRNLIPAELAKGFGFFQGKPPSAFSPVAITPDELGDKWRDGRVHLPIICTLNGRELGHPNAGVEAQFGFGELIAHAAKTRPLGAGTIIGSGTISNSDRSAGIACIAERRMIEKIEQGESKTPFLKYGDVIRIEMKDGAGASVFGAIEQKIVAYEYKSISAQKRAQG